MSMTKEKIGVVAISLPVIVALALILLPFISYLAWVLGQFMLAPGTPRDPAGPSTVFDFIGIDAGYMILGIVLSFVVFPVFTEGLKNMKREAYDHALLLEELHAHDAYTVTAAGDVSQLSNRELVFRINQAHAACARSGIGEKLLCFKCGTSISARHNIDFHGSCADCHYMARGLISYLKGAGFIAIATLLAIITILAGISWLWWVVAGIGLIAIGIIAWGHYLRESKARL